MVSENAALPANSRADTGAGRFQKGQSGNPAGKAPGTKSWRARLASQLREDAGDLLTKMKEKALAGDVQALRFLLERALPPVRATAPLVDIPALSDTEDRAEQAHAVIAAVGRGELPADVAGQLLVGLRAAAELTDIAAIKKAMEREGIL